MTARPSIELHIEELVIHGGNPADRHRIGEAIEVELASRLSQVDSGSHFARNRASTRCVAPSRDGS